MADNPYQRQIPPKKSLGQHFLTNDAIAKDIATSIQNNGLPVLEIGPGTGALTEHLLPIFKDQLYLIEIDSRSVEYLKKAFPALSNQIFNSDFLQFNIPKHFPEGVNIIGNFPYNISSQILFQVFQNVDFVPQFAGMFQQEVAERICATPKSKQYGQLTLQRQLYYDAELLFSVEPHHFDPPPKVISGVIHLQRNKKEISISDKQFKTIVKSAFQHRRKMLRNSLQSFFTKEELQEEVFTKRPEHIDFNTFVELASKASF